MTGILNNGSSRLVLLSGRAHLPLAEDVARELGTELRAVSAPANGM